jgi:hypothetical protein
VFAIVIGIIGIGLTAYSLLTRESDDERIAREAAEKAEAARIAGNSRSASLTGPLPSTRAAIACGMTARDWSRTDAWTGRAFGYTLPLATRLGLMASAAPVTLWPDYARRVECALRGS